MSVTHDRTQLVRLVLDEAAAAGLNLVRAWAHASSPEYALQPSPGRFSEPVFRGLDYALDQARRRGLKVSAALNPQGFEGLGLRAIPGHKGSRARCCRLRQSLSWLTTALYGVLAATCFAPAYGSMHMCSHGATAAGCAKPMR